MPIPSVITELIEKFELHKESYTSGIYNEAQLRIEFIDPFFEALGWDINNKQGYAENYKEVIHEDAIKVGGVTKAPDYCFRIGGVRKFFLEAKKPSVDIKEAIHPAYQLRRYAWSAKLPLSILTDFEEFAIYDCRIKPSPIDKSSIARTLYLKYTDYIDKWDDITNIFSKDAILKGSFDKYVEITKIKKGTAEVDDAFLKEIESWRDILARNIAIRNPQLSQRELNFAVQQSIDRIIFLRICEDRGIENYGRLQALLNGTQIYNRLGELFRMADERYNSGLFYFRKESGRFGSPDELTLNLTIDDNTLKEIIKNLYYPDSPYEFSVLPAYILGYVYEQFLGKVIRLTAGHRAVVEEKPEVRKAGGVYYTPTYIVDYIVKNTVGKLVENKSPNEVEKLRILDPACGSGSFLLGAYQYLLDWHQNWYTKNNPEKWLKGRNPRLVERRKGDFRLTTPERKRILLNNIYGVDIDPQAVEVTKLSLLLKVLEGETEETIVNQLKLFHERALPDLANNIKCGNSLIGPDFYENQQMDLFNEEERYRINAFDWNTEFPEIMHTGGFDAVIGNPPYISIESTSKIISNYYVLAYASAYGRVNSFSLFLEKSIILLKISGYCGFIISNRILTNTQLSHLRDFLLNQSKIESIVTFKKAVFKAAVDTTIITLQKNPNLKDYPIKIYFDTDGLLSNYPYNIVHSSTFRKNQFFIFNTRQNENTDGIIQKIESSSVKLEEICEVRDGIILGAIKDLFISNSKLDIRYEKWLEGNEVSRFLINWTGRYICYDQNLLEMELSRKKEKAKMIARTDEDFKKISSSGVRLRESHIFKQEKILTRQNAKRIIGVYDDKYFFVKNSLHCILLKNKEYNLKFVLGLINSKLMNFYFQNQIGTTGEIFSQMKIAYIKKLPIYTIDFNNQLKVNQYNKIIEFVEKILLLNKDLLKAKTEHEKTLLKRQIVTKDCQIDRLVYELYELNEEEIKIIEESNL